jgi:hypothetical protein
MVATLLSVDTGSVAYRLGQVAGYAMLAALLVAAVLVARRRRRPPPDTWDA